MHLRHLTGEKIKAVTEAICGKLGIAPEQLPKVQWGEGNSRKLWEAVAEAMGFKVQQLGPALMSYKQPKSAVHRPEFEARLRVVAPQWFSHDPAGKKAELKAIAMRGEPRPAVGKHPRGRALFEYTGPKSKTYDPVFDQEIRALRPDWFVLQSEKADLKKAELKAMAMRGEPRPAPGKHPLGTPLFSYTNPKSCYDPVFDQEIRALRPDWFVLQSEKADLKKAELKAMAMRGEPRPNQKKNPLGAVLCRYTNPKSGCYDPVFDQEIRALAPHWFADTEAHNKLELKAMAMRGEPRPAAGKHPLGAVLSNYTNPNSKSYDPVFDQELRSLRPDWFTRSTQLRNSRTTNKKAKKP